MANKALITTGQVIENSAAVLLRRIRNQLGDPFVPADFSAVTWKVYDITDPADEELVDSGTFTIADVVLPALDTGYLAFDEEGYNVIIQAPGAWWPEAGDYRVEVKFTPVTGDAFYQLWEVEATNIYSE